MRDRSKKALTEAVNALEKGEIVAFPTDTVYAIGADYCREDAVRRIYRVKARDTGRPLTLMLHHARSLSEYVKSIPKTAERLMETFWPGPITLIFKASGKIPEYMSGPARTVGVRVPRNETARALIESRGSPLATTSANLSGGQPLRSGSEVLEQFGDRIGVVIPGFSGTGPPSAVLNLSEFPPTLQRAGAISPLLIARTLRRKIRLAEGVFFKILLVCTGNACRSPMAEGLLRSMVPDDLKKKVIVSSAGTAPLEGGPPTANAIEAARALGADISGLTSKLLKPVVISKADLILTMERAHRDRVAELVPEAWEKTHLLKGYGRTGIPAFEREIRDPIGMPLDFYASTAREIRDSLKGVVAELARWLHA